MVVTGPAPVWEKLDRVVDQVVRGRGDDDTPASLADRAFARIGERQREALLKGYIQKKIGIELRKRSPKDTFPLFPDLKLSHPPVFHSRSRFHLNRKLILLVNASPLELREKADELRSKPEARAIRKAEEFEAYAKEIERLGCKNALEFNSGRPKPQ